MPGDLADVSIWNTYEKMLDEADDRGCEAIRKVERFEFYEEARKA